MASVNKVILLGRLGKDPDFKQAKGGLAICNVALATSRKFRDKDGNRQEEVEWHRVALFGRTAEIARDYLKKGSEVYIEGRLRTREWEQDGVKRWSTEIVAESMQLGARPKDGSAGSTPANRTSSNDYARASGRAAPAEADTGEDIPF